MGEVKLDIEKVREFSKKMRENISRVHYSSIKDFEKSDLNKLIVKQIMNAVKLGQEEVSISFSSLDRTTQKTIIKYFQKLGFETQFINIENRNTVIFEGLEDLSSLKEYQEKIIKQAVGEEIFDNMSEEEIENFSEDVGKIMKKMSSNIPQTEIKLELRICWDGTFYSVNKNFSDMERYTGALLDDFLDEEKNQNFREIIEFLDNLEDLEDFEEDDDEEEEDL